MLPTRHAVPCDSATALTGPRGRHTLPHSVLRRLRADPNAAPLRRDIRRSLRVLQVQEGR